MVKETLECLYLLSHKLTITDRTVLMLIQSSSNNPNVKNPDRRSTRFKSAEKIHLIRQKKLEAIVTNSIFQRVSANN